jgi:hypothetical protein
VEDSRNLCMPGPSPQTSALPGPGFLPGPGSRDAVRFQTGFGPG